MLEVCYVAMLKVSMLGFSMLLVWLNNNGYVLYRNCTLHMVMHESSNTHIKHARNMQHRMYGLNNYVL
jgi:hypothetical protein